MREDIGNNYTRAEMIKQARDHFEQNRDHASEVKRAGNYYRDSDNDVLFPMQKSKAFFIRLIVAGILFLLVITMDQMSISYNEIKISSIQEMIETNQTLEGIQQASADFAEEKIIPVFHRLW